MKKLTEAEFKKQCILAKKQRGTGNMALVGMVGIDLKAHMSGWLAKQVLGGAATNADRLEALRAESEVKPKDGLEHHMGF